MSVAAPSRQKPTRLLVVPRSIPMITSSHDPGWSKCTVIRRVLRCGKADLSWPEVKIILRCPTAGYHRVWASNAGRGDAPSVFLQAGLGHFLRILLRRLLVFALFLRGGRQRRRLREGEVRAGADEAGGLELLDAWQVVLVAEPEMHQELLGCGPGHRAARRLAPAFGADPARLHEHVERAAADDDAADLLDLGAGHRLVIGDDGERLDGGARQLARHRLLELEARAEV